jgi:hypothetical protein
MLAFSYARFILLRISLQAGLLDRARDSKVMTTACLRDVKATQKTSSELPERIRRDTARNQDGHKEKRIAVVFRKIIYAKAIG